MTPLDLDAVQAALNPNPSLSSIEDNRCRALIAALRAHREQLEHARPFVIQYGAKYELERLDIVLASIVDHE